MSDYPDLTNYGYQITAELGRNREGGRITWSAIAMETNTQVAVKQFCFAQANSSWSGYKAHAQEIKILQNLNHPGIPKYIDSIETENGFCLVQEYISAAPCGEFRTLTVVEVKTVAGKILDMLIYLQQQTPPVLHRDLSTNNILLTKSLDVYLIDFGFSCLDSEDVSTSSIFRGTPGFIAPEQIIQAVKASDLYSLGIVLICLLTQKTITELLSFTTPDDPYQLDLEQLLPNLEPDFFAWLAKMTNAKVSQRFADALSAKQAFDELDSSLTWVKDTENSALTKDLQLSFRPQLQAVTGIAVTSVTAIATWSISFAYSQVELSFVSVGIAVLAALAIAVTQLGAATIASGDSQARIQGFVLSTLVPLLLVGASGLIWGASEAVIISAAVVVAEVCLLSYYWGQLPSKNPSRLIRGGFWLSAIAIGITAGLYI
ncbi:MAG: protein kinase [Cyanobacteria bacterium J06600_6]